MAEIPVVTIDGPAGSGKGTLAHRVASEMGWHILDSGALYRLVALDALKKGVSLKDESSLRVLAEDLDVRFEPNENGRTDIYLHDELVTDEVRTEDCGCAASEVAACGAVRVALLERQRKFLQEPGLVADGRDMGTTIFPNASVKVYLTASAEERARRRQGQLKEQGIDVSISCLVRDIEERDARDSGRKESPLKPADDAILIDTDQLGIDLVVERVMGILRKSL